MKPKVIKKSQGLAIHVLGDQQIIKLTGEDTGNLFSVIEQSYEPNQGSSSHKHINDAHVFYVLAGEFKLEIAGTISTMTIGDLAYIPKQTFHSFSVVSDVPGRVLLFTLPAGLENFFTEIDKLSESDRLSKIDDIATKYGIRRPGQPI